MASLTVGDFHVSGLDIQDSLEFLKDAITMHFMNIREADSCFGNDHAELLKSHIDNIVAGRSLVRNINSQDPADPLDMWPSAISNSLPRATINPQSDIGTLQKLPREIRDIIYKYALSPDFCPHSETCTCIKEARKATSSLGLLLTCATIYNEALPLLYQSTVFRLSLGYSKPLNGYDLDPVTSIPPTISRSTLLCNHPIAHLPHNAFHLIQNLELEFINDTLREATEDDFPFTETTNFFHNDISQVCSFLQDAEQLQSLDINLSFACAFADIDYMTRLLEPFVNSIRGVRDPDIRVYAYQYVHSPSQQVREARWFLTDECTDLLVDVMRSPRGAGAPENWREIVPVWEDCFEDKERMGDEELNFVGRVLKEEEKDMMMRYLRDVYGTEDLEALHGGMPECWQIWLNSEHDEDCEWFNADDENQSDWDQSDWEDSVI